MEAAVFRDGEAKRKRRGMKDLGREKGRRGERLKGGKTESHALQFCELESCDERRRVCNH